MAGTLTAPLPVPAFRLGGGTHDRYEQTVNTVRDSKQSTKRSFVLRAILAVLFSALFLSDSALADRGERRGGGTGFDRFVVPGGARDNPAREAIREDQRRQRRLSDEQRQQLRRDIDEAGRDIYRRPRRFRDE
jgi:hypothetical protein